MRIHASYISFCSALGKSYFEYKSKVNARREYFCWSPLLTSSSTALYSAVLHFCGNEWLTGNSVYNKCILNNKFLLASRHTTDIGVWL